MSESDFRSYRKGLSSPPTLHYEIPLTTTISDWNALGFESPPRVYWIKEDGDLIITDSRDVTLTYPVVRGQIIRSSKAKTVQTSGGCVAYAQW